MNVLPNIVVRRITMLKKWDHNIAGKKFGRLLVLGKSEIRISETTKKNGKKQTSNVLYWLCKCDCGNELWVRSYSLLYGAVSCGCWKKNQLPQGIGAKKSVLHGYTKAAKRNKLPFKLSFDEFVSMTQLDCFYCGEKPSRTEERAKAGSFTYNGIDRIDSTKGYVKGNIVPCCSTCNYIKSNMDQKDFFAQIEKILTKRRIDNDKKPCG